MSGGKELRMVTDIDKFCRVGDSKSWKFLPDDLYFSLYIGYDRIFLKWAVVKGIQKRDLKLVMRIMVEGGD